VSSAPKSKLTKLARQNIVADAAYLKEQRLVQQVDTLNQTVRALKKKKKVRKPKFAKQPCVASLVADHYDVHKSTISRILQTAREEGSVSPRKRSGRPSQLTPTKRRAVVSTFNETKGRASYFEKDGEQYKVGNLI
jgi:DNA-binding transcriptional MocR family regulator